ncbi:MAG TPA: SBBP repeat-containing protein [Saprospiraceae bacterium]|nr:SBBP repeat-containing protein [Saprospiraceae bacterium]HPI09068.1 SBBP repeat-containing protein [Saprospiraceae bacterium]
MKIKFLFFPIALFLLPLAARAQAWKWAKSLGTPNNSTSVKNIRPYTGTNVLVSGSFAAPSLTFGSQTLANAGQDDGFVAISNDAGQYTWAAQFGGSARDFVVDAAASPTGDLVVAGNFSSISLTIGATNLFNSGETDAFLAKYNPDKTLAWAVKIGSAEIDEISGVVLDANGNTYVSGQVTDKFSQKVLNVFLRKYDAAGSLVWETIGTIQGGILQTTALTLDDNQNIYLAGSVSGTVAFDGISFSSDDDYSAFIVKYNDSGALLDHVVVHGLDKFNGLQAHGNHIYACAEKVNWSFGWGWPLTDSKIHVLQFDLDLNTVWEKLAGGETPAQSLDIARGISVDSSGNAYVTGYFFSDTLHFAGQALPNLYNVNYYYPQIFVFKYAPSGDELWGKSFGGIHSDEGTGIYAFGDDQFYLGGNFESEPVAFGAYGLHNTGTLDSMYVHLRPARYVRKTLGFLAVFDKNLSDTNPEPAFRHVVLFPNPAADHLTLRLTSPTQSPLTLYISSSDGRLLRQSEHSGQFLEIRADLNGLAPGLYFVTLKSAGGVFSSKFVKGF